VQAKLTVVIYMGVTSAAHIEHGLLQGLSASTPAAIIQNASLPTQRHVLCTLGELAHTIHTQGMASPSVMVVGDVLQGLLAASDMPLSYHFK
jgi:uroporphyrin-III C-methyltransferase